MTISILQERQTSNGAGNVANIQLAFSNPLTPGSSIHVICSGIDTATSFTCADSVNGSYGAALDTIDQVGDTQRLAHFKFDNNTSSGTPTVTITPNTSIAFLAIWIREIGGTSGYDAAHKTALQTGIGNGTDNITTGTQAPNNQPGLLSALGVCTSNFVLPAAGTGFTAGANGWTFGTSNTACTESERYTALTAIAATFSNSGGSNNFATLAAFFKESASTTAAAARSAPLSPMLGNKVAGPLGFAGFALRNAARVTNSTLNGSGTAALVIGQSGALTGVGALTGSSALAFGQTGAIAGQGAVAGTSALTFGQSGTLTQPGLQGASALVFGQSGTLTAAGVLAGSSALVFNETGALTGAGVLAGTSALTFAQTAAVTAAGVLAGASALTFAQTASLTASGALAGTSALSFAGSATADLPAGALVGSASMTLAASATLSAMGALIGNCQILIEASAHPDQSNQQPGALDSPRISDTAFRRKRKTLRKIELPAESVFIAPTSLESIPQSVIDRVPSFTALSQTLGESPAALSVRIDREIEFLMRAQAERDDEDALVWIVRALGQLPPD